MTRELIISSIQALWTSPAILESHQDRHSLPAILGFIKVATRQDFYSSPAMLADSPGFLLITRDARGLVYRGLAPLADSLIGNSLITASPHSPTHSSRTRLSQTRHAWGLARSGFAIADLPIADSPRSGTRPQRPRHRGLIYCELVLADSP